MSLTAARVLALALAVLVLGAGSAFAMPWLLDRAVFAGAHMRLQQADPPPGAEAAWLERPGGARLESWFFPSDAPGQGPAILYFHGNAELIDQNVGLAESYAAAGYHVLLAEYRGYGRSTGQAGARPLPGDAQAFFDLLAARPEVDRDRIAVIGRSLGGSAAGAVMRARTPCAVVLEQTFTSLADMVAAAGFPRMLAGDALNTEAAVAAYAGPVLVTHGEADEVIPFAQGRRLAQAAAAREGALSRFERFPGRHNPMAPFPEIRAAVLSFLNETACAAPPLDPW